MSAVDHKSKSLGQVWLSHDLKHGTVFNIVFLGFSPTCAYMAACLQSQ